MMFGTSIRCSKISIVLVILMLYLGFVYFYEWFGGNGRASSIVDKNPGTKVSLVNLLVASVEAAKRGGRMVKQVKAGKNMGERSKGKTAEGVNDPVTLGDMLSHEKMYFSLLKMFPDVHIVSEEKSTEIPDDIRAIRLDDKSITEKLASTFQSEVNAGDITVWIDPLDATKEYTENLTEYVTTMVCVAHKGEPVIGVIHSPFHDQTVWAWKGHGSSPIPNFQTLADSTNLDHLRIIVSRSHQGEVGKLAAKAFGPHCQVSTAGGAGFKALSVAERNSDVYMHNTAIKKWDICAGHALLRTVGGDMTDLRGNTIDYSLPVGPDRVGVKLTGGLVATYRNHEIIVDKLKKAVADEKISA